MQVLPRRPFKCSYCGKNSLQETWFASSRCFRVWSYNGWREKMNLVTSTSFPSRCKGNNSFWNWQHACTALGARAWHQAIHSTGCAGGRCRAMCLLQWYLGPLSQNWNRALNNCYLWKLVCARHLVTTCHARWIVQHWTAPDTFLMSLLVPGRVKVSRVFASKASLQILPGGLGPQLLIQFLGFLSPQTWVQCLSQACYSTCYYSSPAPGAGAWQNFPVPFPSCNQSCLLRLCFGRSCALAFSASRRQRGLGRASHF